MSAALASMTLALAMMTPSGGPYQSHYSGRHPHGGGEILRRGPGDGWGFPNGNPDGYGWYSVGTALPLGADRTPEYYFPRHMAVEPAVLFFPNYYNGYVTRGQRYIPYVGCGGFLHPAGGRPPAPATLPSRPYRDATEAEPTVAVPAFTGRSEAPPINSGSTDLIP